MASVKIEELCECGRERRALCPGCGRYVKISGGKFAVHEVGHCLGSHMVYKACSHSEKLAVTR